MRDQGQRGIDDTPQNNDVRRLHTPVQTEVEVLRRPCGDGGQQEQAAQQQSAQGSVASS